MESGAKASLIIRGSEGNCSMCPQIRFIAGADDETVSLLKQFEAHCRKAHPDKTAKPGNG